MARQLSRQSSPRDYAGAIDQCLDGYGIAKSSLSRPWQVATAAALAPLCQWPVPKDLVALLMDGQSFRHQCLIVALGVDRQGHKYRLGLWHGATENAPVVRELQADERKRGLDIEPGLRVVIDGANALSKGIRKVFGKRALVQRCQVHKRRNVLDHLPQDKRPQSARRLRMTWAQPTAQAALKALRAWVTWLDTISSSPARSLEEGFGRNAHLAPVGPQRASPAQPFPVQPD